MPGIHVFFLPVSIEPGVEKYLELFVGDRVLCLRNGALVIQRKVISRHVLLSYKQVFLYPIFFLTNRVYNIYLLRRNVSIQSMHRFVLTRPVSVTHSSTLSVSMSMVHTVGVNLECRRSGFDPRPSHIIISIHVVSLPYTWRCRVTAWTGQPRIRVL